MFPLTKESISAEDLIQRLSTHMPKSVQKFNAARIELDDTSKLHDAVNKKRWVNDIKTLRWYGPFKHGENNYRFVTATSEGNFEGFYLSIWLDSSKEIYLNFLGKDSNSCGDRHFFNNQ